MYPKINNVYRTFFSPKLLLLLSWPFLSVYQIIPCKKVIENIYIVTLLLYHSYYDRVQHPLGKRITVKKINTDFVQRKELLNHPKPISRWLSRTLFRLRPPPCLEQVFAHPWLLTLILQIILDIYFHWTKVIQRELAHPRCHYQMSRK